MATQKLKIVKVPWSEDEYKVASDTSGVTLDDTNKTYLTGVTTAPTSTTQDLEEKANTAVYATAGTVSATKYRVGEKVRQEYNSTTESLDFIFE